MNYQEEIWKDVIFAVGKYQISNKGRVKVRLIRKGWKITNIKTNPKKRSAISLAYKQISINSKTYYIHRVVALMFIPNPENKPEVNHIDFNTLNNNANNLEWVTSKENKNKSTERYSIANRGEKHPIASITDKIALSIKIDRKKGLKYKQLMIKYNLPEYTISNVCTRSYSHLDKIV